MYLTSLVLGLSLCSYVLVGSAGVLQARNLIVGPLTEEFVFRTIMIPILLKGGWSREYAVAISMMSFALCKLPLLLETNI